MPLWVKTPPFARLIYPNLVWQIPDEENSLYLTFDDGPTPDITDWVLYQLEQYRAKATFFCLGEQAEQYPELLQKTISLGHSVGNHTFSHVRGWQTPLLQYAEEVAACAALVPSGLFRPPYGSITPKQARYLLQHPHICKLTQAPRIIMWSAISADWKKALPWQVCLNNVLKNVPTRASKNSPIVVFHDSVNAFKNLKEVLPRVLAHYADKGMVFKSIPM